jgi:hypothetical protein
MADRLKTRIFDHRFAATVFQELKGDSHASCENARGRNVFLMRLSIAIELAVRDLSSEYVRVLIFFERTFPVEGNVAPVAKLHPSKSVGGPVRAIRPRENRARPRRSA